MGRGNWLKKDENTRIKLVDGHVIDFNIVQIPNDSKEFFALSPEYQKEYYIELLYADKTEPSKTRVYQVKSNDNKYDWRIGIGIDNIRYLLGDNPSEVKDKKALQFEKIGEKKYRVTVIDTPKELLKSEGKIEDINEKQENQIEKQTHPLNRILFGPPGTGKTYNTINYAVAIVENKDINDILEESFEDVKSRYDDYKEWNLINFVTFHQSYGYEDFIEGIKPVVKNGQITYNIEPGVFKKFCERCENSKIQSFTSDAHIWKVSLKNSKNPDFWKECISDGCIRIGFEENTNKVDKSLSYFKNDIKAGDCIIGMNSQQSNVVVGKVTGDYEYRDEFEDFKHYRKVEWLGFYDKKEFVSTINNETGFTLSTVYSLDKIRENLPLLLNNLSNDDKLLQTDINAAKPHVLIIDEINRGNISKIFGELITLIEESKRSGKPEEAEVILPYSKQPFSVPNNLYILGTMNTADRSLTKIDTALRRRFTFIETMPDSHCLEGINVEGISIKDLLETMNDRIEFLRGRDQLIGHAWFMELKRDNSIEKLGEIFKNKIIPLLQEYFYDDYHKIQMVLGDTENGLHNFIIREDCPSDLFSAKDRDEAADCIYTINEKAFNDIEAYKKIYPSAKGDQKSASAENKNENPSE